MNSKINILLVDDRPEGLVTLEAVLDNPDYNLVKAGSGKEALAKVLMHEFALILMDVQMPEMDGFETAAIIKQREKSRDIPIIFITAINKADHFVSTGYSVGAVDYLFKPFDSNILKSKVSVFVDLYRKSKLLQAQAEALREIEIRDRMRTLVELEMEGRRRYQNLADAIPQIVFRACKRRNFEYLNQFWCSYTGLALKESVGNGWQQCLHPEDLQNLLDRWEESAQAQVGFEMECRIQEGQTGDFRWHLLRVVPEYNNLTELICWIGTATDIHDQKLIQEELFEAKGMAEAANETKSRFLANMSHEIRTPLGAILGFSELLADGITQKPERAEAIAAVRRNGEQLSKIIDEILDLSKVEAGKLDVASADLSTVDLLNGVKSFVTLSAKEKGLDLEFKVDGQIPVTIRSNATRLQQVLVNVIGNGIKFSTQGKVVVTVSLRDRDTDSSLLAISVKDSGPGLTSAQIRDLFQPFTQVDTSMTRRYGGTGLGLALSRKLARALGGDIEVAASRPGEGCNFIITLATGPLTDVKFTDKLDVQQNFESEAPHAPETSLDGVRVLLVEDSVDNQILIGRFLSLAGAGVDLANNGIEGVNKAMEGDHHIILMDIQMPELDGYGAIAQLRSKGFEKPIIALTAHGMIEERRRCFNIGANDHITKPVNRAALIERIYELVSVNKGSYNSKDKPQSLRIADGHFVNH